MKKLSFVLAFVMLLGILSGCSAQETPAQQAPAQTTAPAPTEALVLDMQALYDTLIAAENMPEMLPLEADMQMNFCGINPEDCLQSAVAICANSLRTDELWLIEARDADALARIEAAAQTRLTAKAEESQSYSPEQYAIVQKAQIITVDNYFILVVSPDVDALAGMVRTAAGI